MKRAILEQIGEGVPFGVCFDQDPPPADPPAADPPSDPPPGDPPADPAPWSHAEGVAGEGDAPEWFKGDKYATVADQAKAYKELEGKFGSFSGAPDEYEVKVSEELAEKGVEIDGEDVMVQEAMKFAKEAGMNQEGFEKMLDVYSMVELAKAEAWKEESATEMKTLGQNAQGRIENITKWANATLSEELVAGMNAGPSTAAGVKFLEHIIGMTQAAPLDPEGGAAQGSVTESELKEMQFATDDHGNRKIQTDPAFKAEYEKKMKQFYGEGDHQIVVGG